MTRPHFDIGSGEKCVFKVAPLTTFGNNMSAHSRKVVNVRCSFLSWLHPQCSFWVTNSGWFLSYGKCLSVPGWSDNRTSGFGQFHFSDNRVYQDQACGVDLLVPV